jgi:hypothetical protein
MALQTQNLVMTGLGTLGDTLPNTLQPPLVDGIHLDGLSSEISVSPGMGSTSSGG